MAAAVDPARPILRITDLATLLCVLSFAYHLGPQDFRREGRWVIGMAMLAAVATTVATWGKGGAAWIDGMSILAAAAQSWGIVVLLRRWRRSPIRELPGAFNRHS